MPLGAMAGLAADGKARGGQGAADGARCGIGGKTAPRRSMGRNRRQQILGP